MKTVRTAFIALMAVVCLPAFSQKSFSIEHPFVGIDANLSKFTLDDFKFKFGYAAEAGVEVSLASVDKLIFIPSIQFITKKSSLEYVESVNTTKYKNYSLSYLQIPIRVGYQFQTGDFVVTPFVGPYIGVGLFGNYDYKAHSGKGNDLGIDINVGNGGADPFDNMSRFEVGLTAGVRCDFREKYCVSLHYDNSLNDIGGSAWIKSVRWQTIGLGLSYKFK